MKITAHVFESFVGSPPKDDDLERCNCPQAGEPGHYMCGWSTARQLPNFMIPFDQINHRKE